MPNSSETSVGSPARRKEDFRFITGQGQYTDDISHPRQAFAAFVRSPHAHAKILDVDAADALAAPGVITVLSGQDLAAEGLGTLSCGWMIHSKDGSEMKAGAHPMLAEDRVRYVGDHVAVVIAESALEARDAAEQVNVDYDELPAIVSTARAQDTNAPQVHDIAPRNTCFEWEIGDRNATDAAIAKASHVTTIDVINNRLVPNAMEPRASVAVYDGSNDHYTLHVTSQAPHLSRLIISAFIGLAPEHKLRVISPDVGGGFGSKINTYPEEIVCLWASKKVSRPVKWTAERSESFLTDTHGRDHVSHAELALDDSGNILGLRVKTIANLGAYLGGVGSVVPTILYATVLSGPYNIPAIYCEVDGVYANSTPTDAYRGAGRPEATFLLERLMDRAARELGKDPVEFRRQNFIREFPHQTPVILTYDIGDYDASLDKALQLSGYAEFEVRNAEAKARGKLRGIGLATYIEACGVAPSQAVGSLGSGIGLWESAEVRVNPSGSVEVFSGCHSHGQGHETTYAQLTAERLGVPFENVEVVQGDTDKVQFGMGTYGSRSTPVGMSALSLSCDKIIAKSKKIAAHLLDVNEDSVAFDEGIFSSKETNKSLQFAEVALQAYLGHNFPTDEIEPGLKESTFYDPKNFTFPAGCHICEVEVDPDTGLFDIVNFVAVDDFGTVINPMIVEGQVHGGIAQGVGQAAHESCIYDTTSGQLLTGSYMDYCMPRASDLPDYKVAMTVTECPSNPLGVKGCGEAGAIAATPALINALTNALGVDDIEMPATPERVWRAAKMS